MPDHGNSPDLTPEEIGNTWLNYLINERTILWWGGLGNSTEHTAYIRLKEGVPAPASGSMALNGKTIAEQIGAQIFIDGWGMLFPGDPERAVDFARRAGSVSHDGEAIYGAQVIAAMLAQGFVESDLNALLDVAVSYIPANSTITRVIRDVRAWHAEEPDDWRATLSKIQANYGYDKYGGACHMVPNHALIIMALLYGGDDFRKAQMIVNTSGWDTDCNAANVGAILGVKNGLAGIDESTTTGADRSPTACISRLPMAAVPSRTRSSRRITSSMQPAPWPGPKRWSRRTARASTSRSRVQSRDSNPRRLALTFATPRQRQAAARWLSAGRPTRAARSWLLRRPSRRLKPSA